MKNKLNNILQKNFKIGGSILYNSFISIRGLTVSSGTLEIYIP